MTLSGFMVERILSSTRFSARSRSAHMLCYRVQCSNYLTLTDKSELVLQRKKLLSRDSVAGAWLLHFRFNLCECSWYNATAQSLQWYVSTCLSKKFLESPLAARICSWRLGLRLYTNDFFDQVKYEREREGHSPKQFQTNCHPYRLQVGLQLQVCSLCQLARSVLGFQ